MVLHQEELPYEIRKMASELFAGKQGFTQEEMKAFFTEEIRKVVSPPVMLDANGFWDRLANVTTRMQFEQKLHHDPFPTHKKAFEYWLSLLPLWRQRELLLELCRKPNFPMGRGKPPLSRRSELAELLTSFVIDPHVSQALQRLDSVYVMTTWVKAMDRCGSDPQGAITVARTLLESVCKHLLDACGSSYNGKDDLPKLYSLLANELKIAPNQQSEQALKRIFGSCQSIVDAVGTLRNQLGDAHGQGKADMELTSYLATFTVNLAGTVAMFLVHAWEADQRALPQILVEN